MRIFIRCILSIFSFLFFSTVAFSQSGKISGKIIDATGEAVPFVNIIVVGTNYGAASNIDGLYSIIGIPPGTFTIKASAIGYNSTTVTNVNVSIDLTTKIDIKLSGTSVELKEEVVVVANRPLVTKDLTSSTSIIDQDEIASLPITEFQDILQLQAGYVGGNVRGGRSGEIVYAIDGVPVTDVYDGSTVVDVNANSIQELQFVSGAFNAEYGKALSGYVNIATKDGNNKFTGSVTSYMGNNYSTHTDIFTDINNFNPTNIFNVEGSLSGPVIPDYVYFYGDARYIYFGGWERGQRVFNPWDITINKGATEPLATRYVIDSTGDKKIVAMNWNRKIYGQGKLTIKPVPSLKVTLNYILDDVDYQDYDQMFVLNPDGNFKKFRRGNTNILGVTHTVDASTFYQANLSYFFKKYNQYVYQDINDPRWVNTSLLSQQPTEVPTFYTGGQQNTIFKRITGTYGFKWDLTSQVTQIHQLKAGVEFNQHHLGFDNITLIQYLDLNNNGVWDPGEPEGSAVAPPVSPTGNPYVKEKIPNINDPNENLNIDTYQRKPIELSGYVQDKIELNELIINLGVRYDYFKSDGKLLVDPSDPNIYNPVRPENIALTMDQRRAKWYKSPTAKAAISPRLGVAFPITDRGVIHFSYGHFFQIPNFELLYQNPEYKFSQGTGNVGVAGNPDLAPEQTISGEVGFQQALTDLVTIDLTGYFRDIRNLAGTRAAEIPIFGGTSKYSQFVNSDFGFVRGIVLSVTKRLSDNWSATLDYTLQAAKGNASDPNATRDYLVSGKLPEIQLVRLNWDQTHTLNATFSYTSPDLWGLSFIASYGSGFPYTPTEAIAISDLLTNSELKPSTINVDLRAYKDFMIGALKITIFTRVYNLFDTKNMLNVYNDSGVADFTQDMYLRQLAGQTKIVNTVNQYYANPTFYSEPRRIEFGASLFF
jgi:hypothetical protein